MINLACIGLQHFLRFHKNGVVPLGNDNAELVH